MNHQKLFTIANQFYQLTKEATLKQNMAKRIMFSLLGHLIPEAQRETHIAQTKGIVDYKALESLKEGAKELLHYGVECCYQELSHVNNYEIQDQIKSLDKNHAKSFLEKAIVLFNDTKSWDKRGGKALYGGPNWARIAQHFLRLHTILKQLEFIDISNNDNLEYYYSILMKMTAEMNIIDGLTHNTDSLMGKMIEMDQKENYPLGDHAYSDASEHRKKDRETIKRMMHAKEMENPDDVLAEILPIMDQNSGNFSSWVSKARQRRKFFSPQAERDFLIAKIDAKKSFSALLKDSNLIEYKQQLLQMLQSLENGNYKSFTFSKFHLAILNTIGYLERSPKLKNIDLEKLELFIKDLRPLLEIIRNKIHLVESDAGYQDTNLQIITRMKIIENLVIVIDKIVQFIENI